jgi:hypothetical protein
LVSNKNIPSKVPVNITSHIGRLSSAIPVGLPPVLKRFWKFAQQMAQQFNKHLVQNREDEFLKVVKKDFEKRGQ